LERERPVCFRPTAIVADAESDLRAEGIEGSCSSWPGKWTFRYLPAISPDFSTRIAAL
jgi:hypothetical protein